MENLGYNSGYIEELYAQYVSDPESVSPSWREFFSDFQPGPSFTGLPAEHKRTDAEAGSEETPETPAEPVPEGSEDGAAPPSEVPVAEPPEEKAPEKPREKEPPKKAPSPPISERAKTSPLRGVQAKIAENMEASLGIPTATSVRQVPVKLLAENRRLINRHQQRLGGDKVSFTHLVAYAIVRALKEHPAMNAAYRLDEEGTPERVDPEGTNLGLAIDIEKGGKRQLLVPNIKGAGSLSFAEFFGRYNDLVRRTREGKLELSDFDGTTATITNPGMIGTELSVPRLMPGQGVILGVGSIAYPTHYASLAPEELSRLGISEVMTLTSTYDHRVTQGAESGEFLRRIEELLTGKRDFYIDVFGSLDLHTPPLRMVADSTPALGRRGITVPERLDKVEKQARVFNLIHAYRVRGHLLADTNPLGYEPRTHTELDPAHYGLTVWDLDREFLCGGLAGHDQLLLRDILDILWDTYTRHIGSEFMHLSNPTEKRWLMERIEPRQFKEPINSERKQRIFHKLNEAEALEQFIHTKYIGHKRFSLEGAESMIPILDTVLSDAADQQTEEAVIGMAHRGRLNVLTNIIGKPYSKVFDEFEGVIDPEAVHGSGDVKYHLGETGMYTTPNGSEIKLRLASNPSHLEAVNPVVEGIARARQQALLDSGNGEATEKEFRDRVLPILLHGDAAFAGQGVVAETLNLSQLEGYRTGGTIHLVVNNQIGFTTLPMHARSSAYATDIARMIQAPIFHVNGDDPEACIRVARLALDFRQVFNKDVVIDMVCYRKYGHNEGDEPSYTQPLMYADIDNHRSVRKLYLEHLLRIGDIEPEEAEDVLDDFKSILDRAFEETKELAEKHKDEDVDVVKPEPKEAVEVRVDTTVQRDDLEAVLRALVTFPDSLHVHKKLARLISRKDDQFEKNAIDWAFAEALAFGTLLAEGTPVRISGQDTGRGTFSQRHAILYDQTDGHRYIPLNHVSEGQARFQVYDSLLSEYAAVGFEYGYSVAEPRALVLWEAQFGDFGNGAQVMIDQFIAAAEAKWNQSSSLVMLLPHAYEGQGPEHSSARLERFLELCAEDNLIVANYSTPANYFHALRRQVKREARKPLIIMTPKSLLRHPKAVSAVDAFTSGRYQPFIPSEDEGADRLVICSGKVYYDLLKAREETEPESSVAIARLEQFYPFPKEAVREELKRHPDAEIIWCQEEPQNMGAWVFVQPRIEALLAELQNGDRNVRLTYAGRVAAASPATGRASVHRMEQEALVREALGV